MPCSRHPNAAVIAASKHSDLAESARAVSVTAHVQHHLHGRGQLAVQRDAVEPAESGKGLEASRHLSGIVGMHRAGASVVAGVESGKQIHDLSAAYLANHDSVRPHPQRLPHEIANGYLADAFDVGASRDELDQMRMRRREFGCVLHADDAFICRNGAQDRGQQRLSCLRRFLRR